jgi:hypothetical protein
MHRFNAIHMKRSNANVVSEPYGHQTAVFSIHPRSYKELRCRLPDGNGAEPCQSNEICCSVNKKVNKRRTVLLALSSHLQMMDLPVVRHQMHSNVRKNRSYGHQMAISTTQLRSEKESQQEHLEVSKLRHNGAVDEICPRSDIAPKTKSFTLFATSRVRKGRQYLCSTTKSSHLDNPGDSKHSCVNINPTTNVLCSFTRPQDKSDYE